jgi:hypothetical protein
MGKPIGGEIPFQELKKMRDAYQAKYPGTTQSVAFSKEMFKKMLSMNGDRIRAHFCTTEDGANTIAFTIEGAESLKQDSESAIAFDRGQGCPPYC